MLIYRFLLISFFLNASALAQSFNIGIPTDVHKDLKLFLENKDITEIKNFKGKYSRRDVVEVILFYQALKLGGFPYQKLKLIHIDSYKRITKMLSSGSIAANVTSMWSHDLTTSEYYSSIPLIEEGQFFAGIYTTKENLIHKIKKIEDIKQYTAVSSEHWKSDWATLSELNLKAVMNVSRWILMPRIVEAKRADFTLAPFQETNDLSLKSESITLYPVQNLKVALRGSRHFFVSKQSKIGNKLFEALQIGIRQLKENGIFKKAYEQSGFINPKTKDWKVINPVD